MCTVENNLSDVCSISRGTILGSGLGPTLYLVIESDDPKSELNLLLKYADCTNLLDPENTDVNLADEFRHIMQ